MTLFWSPQCNSGAHRRCSRSRWRCSGAHARCSEARRRFSGVHKVFSKAHRRCSGAQQAPFLNPIIESLRSTTKPASEPEGLGGTRPKAMGRRHNDAGLTPFRLNQHCLNRFNLIYLPHYPPLLASYFSPPASEPASEPARGPRLLLMHNIARSS